MSSDNYQKKFWSDQKRDERRSPHHPVIVAYTVPKIQFIQNHITIEKNDTLLDAGCGNGYFTVHWAKICQTTGMDYSQKMLDNNPHPNLILGDVTNMPFVDNSFDIVFCSNLLHHLSDPSAALKEMRRVAKKYVIITEPNRNNPLLFLFACLKKEEHGILPFTKNYLIQKGLNVQLKLKAAITTGLIFPNKTPVKLLPLLKKFDRSIPFGAIIEIIFEK